MFTRLFQLTGIVVLVLIHTRKRAVMKLENLITARDGGQLCAGFFNYRPSRVSCIPLYQLIILVARSHIFEDHDSIANIINNQKKQY